MADKNKIEMINSRLIVPDAPVIPFVHGDGIGAEIWGAAQRVLDAAVKKAYGGNKRIQWKEVLAGEKAQETVGTSLPDETISAFNDYRVGIKGPLATPVGKGHRSLNVALRQILDLYVCLRPVRWFEGVPSPVRNPEKIDMVVFRENTEDVYAGLEFAADSSEAKRLIEFCRHEFNWNIREGSGVGLKPVSQTGSKRLVRAAIKYAVANNRKSVTLIHKGNIMKFTEGAFRNWGYEVARTEFSSADYKGGPWQVIRHNNREIVVKDIIADAFFQEALIRPEEFDVIATTNLNGDYISDALAAQVGGIGIAPGGNINYETGHAIFEATHGTAPDIAGKNIANPLSLILSGEMMLRYLGWSEAADRIIRAVENTIRQKRVTYDFYRTMDGAENLSTSAFADAVIENIK